MKTDEELFDFLEILKQELVDSGNAASAERIELASHISSVGTEILMTLRFELYKLQSAKLGLGVETMEGVGHAIEAINTELSR